MENKIEIEYRGVIFSVKPPFRVSFQETTPEGMTPNIEKMLQTICFYTLSAFAGLKDGAKYDCKLQEKDKETEIVDQEYKRGKYTIIHNFTEYKGENSLYIIFDMFDIELKTSLSSEEISNTKLHNLILAQINSFMNLVTSYKTADKYIASFYDYDKGLVWTMESDKCPMGTSFKTIESCNN